MFRINIVHNQKVRKFQWRNNFTAKDFIYLIQSTFNISED